MAPFYVTMEDNNGIHVTCPTDKPPHYVRMSPKRYHTRWGTRESPLFGIVINMTLHNPLRMGACKRERYFKASFGSFPVARNMILLF